MQCPPWRLVTGALSGGKRGLLGCFYKGGCRRLGDRGRVKSDRQMVRAGALTVHVTVILVTIKDLVRGLHRFLHGSVVGNIPLKTFVEVLRRHASQLYSLSPPLLLVHFAGHPPPPYTHIRHTPCSGPALAATDGLGPWPKPCNAAPPGAATATEANRTISLRNVRRLPCQQLCQERH